MMARTKTNSPHIDPAKDIVQTLNEDEIAFIAGLDYGQDKEIHTAALREVIFKQGGSLSEGQYWSPYEVIELGANSHCPGHDREFAICTILVIRAVMSGFDTATDLTVKWQSMNDQYAILSEELTDAIGREFALAGIRGSLSG